MGNFKIIARKRAELLKKYPTMQASVTADRAAVVAELENLLVQAEQSLRNKGTQVYFAEDKVAAQQIMLSLCQGTEKVVRIDSPELTEIQFDQLMNAQGTLVDLTDMSEIIAAEAGLEGYRHPLLGRDFAEYGQAGIIKSLQSYIGSKEIEELQELGKLSRQLIRSDIVASDYGITGADAIIADSGTLVLAENEGNGRLVSNLPYRHIAVVGLEKLYANAKDAMRGIQAANIYGLGQNNATYYSLISGPSRTADIEFKMAYGMHGPLEVHLILLDNGRRTLIKKGCGNLLRCVECGGCFAAIEDIAGENGWDEILLTAKNVALLATRHEMRWMTGIEQIADFECPVGITVRDILKAVR